MKVKVGADIIDSYDLPILLYLTDEEKSLISEMGDNNFLCIYPPDFTPSEASVLIREFAEGNNMSNTNRRIYHGF